MAARSAPLSRAQAQARTREEVLEAAESLFLSIGYEATTVAEIAATAGRTQGAIYGNFAGKPALGLEVIQRRYLEQFAGSRRRPSSTPGRSRRSSRPSARGGRPSRARRSSPSWWRSMRWPSGAAAPTRAR